MGRADQNAYAVTTLYLDRTPPAPPSKLTGSPARKWTNINKFAAMWTNPADTSGVVGAYYSLDQPGAYPTNGTFVSTTTTLSNIAVTGEGKHDLYVWLVDAAGNVSHLNRSLDPQVFWYDSIPPASSMALNPPLPASGWYSTTVLVAFQGQDPAGGSGLESVAHRLDDGAWDILPLVQIGTEGEHTLLYYPRDVAGNTEATRQQRIALDLTPPAVTLSAARPPQASGWYTAPVSFSLAATDTLSGAPRPFYRLNGAAWQAGSQFQLTSDGKYKIETYAQDAAGNRSAMGRGRRVWT